MILENVKMDALLNLSFREIYELDLSETFYSMLAEREIERSEEEGETGKIVQMGDNDPAKSKRA